MKKLMLLASFVLAAGNIAHADCHARASGTLNADTGAKYERLLGSSTQQTVSSSAKTTATAPSGKAVK